MDADKKICQVQLLIGTNDEKDSIESVLLALNDNVRLGYLA